MKQNVSYGWGSFWSFVFWCFLIFVVVWFCCTGSYSSGWTFFWWICIFLFFWWAFSAICYAPVGVYADDSNFRIKRVFRNIDIPMNEIASATVYDAGKSTKKGFNASIGSLAKWGTYNDAQLGEYKAYYSNPKKCVMITLKNGEKIVVGSRNPQQLVEYINSRIN